MMNTKLTLLAGLTLLAMQAQAADTAFYQITEVTSTKPSNYGPWPVSMAADKTVNMLSTVNNASSYFDIAPMTMDLADRFRYEPGCPYASDVCSAFWDGSSNLAYNWRSQTVTYQSQNVSLLESTTTAEADGIIKAQGATSNIYVGYKVSDTAANGYYHERTGFAHLGESDIALVSPNPFSNIGGFASANSLLKIDDNTYLIGGTANTSTAADSSSLSNCYNGDTNKVGQYLYCPGFNNQAALWLTSPSAASATAVLAPSFYIGDSSNVQTAAVNGLATLTDGSIYAVGYSNTDKYSSSTTGAKNLAVYWPITVSSGTPTFGTIKNIPLPHGNPGEGDKVLRHTWAVAINKNGLVIGNQKYSVSSGRNYPVEMFVFSVTSGATATTPLTNSPRNGSNSEAAAINDNNQIVGWRDERNQTQPIVTGSPRLQEAFLFNANTSNTWRLNDLICTSSTCVQNGKYYYIAYANAIASDGTIAATAYRYDSYADWSAQTNATVVPITLAPSESFDSNGDVPSSYVVTNALPTVNLGQSSGGGAIPLWLILTGVVATWFRRQKGFKKMS